MTNPTWRVSKLNKTVKEREREIKIAFWEQLGLRIGEPLPSGGNSNDGNTARKFFKEWKEIADRTGLDKTLLEGFHVILSVINSRNEINVDEFQSYTEKIRPLYVSLYGWYPLSPTAHKLLVHGATIIRHAILPIGMLSEEPQETRNKTIRNFREHHARKFSRVVNIEDVFKRLLLTSDPILALSNKKKIGEVQRICQSTQNV